MEDEDEIGEKSQKRGVESLATDTAVPAGKRKTSGGFGSSTRIDVVDEDTELYDLSKYKSVEELDSKCHEIREHGGKGPLKKYLRSLQELAKAPPPDFADLSQLIYMVNSIIKASPVQSVRVTGVAEPRIASVDFEIENSKMEYWRDYYKFEKRVVKLFDWYTDAGKKKYLAPYFAMVQSSGMGKTKLMYELKKNHKANKVFLLLCRDSDVQNTGNISGKVYDDDLTINKYVFDFNVERDLIRKKLDDFVTAQKLAGTDKVILLLDEAHFLLEPNDGFAFRVFRWWLRWNDISNQIVVVIAGTNSYLVNFLKEDPSGSNYSRGLKRDYNTGAELYPPFYETSTIGLGKKKIAILPGADESKLSDFDRAVKFGRPLFAHLAAKGKLDEEAMRGILGRILLSQGISDPHLTKACCLSVLGTRVQMGHTSIKISSELVARGYACLTKISVTASLAYICFFPDPVCAYLAMKLMLPGIKDLKYGTRGPEFWAGEAADIFATGLCYPDKGNNVGEVAAALYLLFCGDVLRAANVDEKAFTVPLVDMMRLAVKPSKDPPTKLDVSSAPTGNPHERSDMITSPTADSPDKSAAPTEFHAEMSDVFTAPRASVSFIQVCRNYLRHTIEEVCTSNYFEEWFTAGCAFYSYVNCRGYDMIAPVRLDRGNSNYTYCPMLISVKNRIAFSSDDKEKAFLDMKNAFPSIDKQIGVCVLVVIGLPKKGPRVKKASAEDKSFTYDTSETVTSKFQDWKGDSILELTVVVPEDDCFGCWNMAHEASPAGGEDSEIFASHVTAHQTAESERALEKAAELLRSKSKFVALLKDYMTKHAEMTKV